MSIQWIAIAQSSFIDPRETIERRARNDETTHELSTHAKCSNPNARYKPKNNVKLKNVKFVILSFLRDKTARMLEKIDNFNVVLQANVNKPLSPYLND